MNSKLGENERFPGACRVDDALSENTWDRKCHTAAMGLGLFLISVNHCIPNTHNLPLSVEESSS